jgi:hypothetical protein
MDNNSMKTRFVLSLFFLWSGFGIAALAQPVLENERVIYTGFEPRLANMEKIESQPVIVDTLRLPREGTYELNQVKIPTFFVPDTLSVRRMGKEPLDKLHRLYAKGGFGNYTTFLGDVGFNSIRNKAHGYSLNYQHYSMNGSISDRGNPAFNINAFSGQYARFFKPLTVQIDAGYQRQGLHYYGFSPENSPILVDSTAQVYVQGRASAQIVSRHRTDSVFPNYKAKLDFMHHADRFGFEENHLRFSGDLNHFTDFFAAEFIGIRTKVDLWQFSALGKGSNAHIVDVHPYLRLGRRTWNVELGAGLAAGKNDSTDLLYVFPRLSGHWNLFSKYIIVHAALGGNVERVGYGNLIQDNPFLSRLDSLSTQHRPFEVRGGIKGAFSNDVSYSLGISFVDQRNAAFFMADSSLTHRHGFTVRYDNLKTTALFAGLHFHRGEKLRIGLDASYAFFSLDTLAAAFHRPALQVKASAAYQLGEKILARADLFFIGSQFSNGSNGGIVELNPTFDANLEAEYRLTKGLSFFARLNNLAAFRYNRYFRYPTIGLTVLGGLSLSL